MPKDIMWLRTHLQTPVKQVCVFHVFISVETIFVSFARVASSQCQMGNLKARKDLLIKYIV